MLIQTQKRLKAKYSRAILPLCYGKVHYFTYVSGCFVFERGPGINCSQWFSLTIQFLFNYFFNFFSEKMAPSIQHGKSHDRDQVWEIATSTGGSLGVKQVEWIRIVSVCFDTMLTNISYRNTEKRHQKKSWICKIYEYIGYNTTRYTTALLTVLPALSAVFVPPVFGAFRTLTVIALKVSTGVPNGAFLK